MKSLKSVGSLAVIIVVLLFSIIYQTILVDSQNVPSLGLLHYMYKKYPNMKLQHCIEAADQCRMFSSCKGLYLHLPTGECLFDNSTVKSDEFTSTTTEATKELVAKTTDSTTEEVAVSTEPITDQVSMVTESTNEQAPMTTDAITELVSMTTKSTTKQVSVTVESTTEHFATTTEPITEQVSMTTKSTTTQISTTTDSTTEYVAMTTESITEQVSMTVKTTTELVPTLQPFTNYTSMYFKEESTDQKIHAKLFDTAELSACFWMKPNYKPSTSLILSVFKIPVSENNCNDLQIKYKQQKLWFKMQGQTEKATAKDFHIGESSHVCLTWNSTEFVFYINGTFDKKYSIDPEKFVASHFAVGNDLDPTSNNCFVNDASSSFLGDIAGLNIWSQVLNDIEMNNVYINGYIPANNLTVAWEDILKFKITDKIEMKNFIV